MALVTPAFYVAWLASTLIVGLLMYMVQWVTSRFDAHYPWHRALANRLAKQTLGGLVLPVLMAFILAAFYFWANATNIFTTIWFDKYLLLIIALLAILNLAYAFYGSLKEKVWPAVADPNSQRVAQAVMDREVQFPSKTEATANLSASTLNPSFATAIDPAWLNIACIFCANKNCYGIDLQGNALIWTHSFGESLALLPSAYFFAINRGCLLNFKAIAGYQHKGSKKVLLRLLPAIEAKMIDMLQNAFSRNATKQANPSVSTATEQTVLPNPAQNPFWLRVSYGKKANFLLANDAFKAREKSDQKHSA